MASKCFVRFMVKSSLSLIHASHHYGRVRAHKDNRPVAADQVLKYRRREMEEANADRSMAPRISAGAMSRTVDWST